jgi:membrane associated rhomboid family serine protease
MHAASVGFHCPACTKSGAQKIHRPGAQNKNTYFTYFILASIVAVYLVELYLDNGGGTRFKFSNDYVLWGEGRPGLAPGVVGGEYWRIVTGAFLHSGLIHLLFNSYFIYTFGRYLEQGIGWLRTGLIYAGGLLGGSAAVLLFNWEVPTLGASGAALGLGGGAVAIMASRGQSITQSPLSRVLLLNLAIPFLIGGISFWGHFGGIIGGALVGAALSFLPVRYGQSQTVAQLVAGAVVVALAVLAVFAGTDIGPSLAGV